MVFNWVPAPVAPKPVVYITDPLADRIVALELDNDGTLFTQTTRYLTSPWLNRPVDIAGTSIETAARNFASNTVIGGGSDLYVLNRGNNTILRMAQDGRIIARRSLDGAVPDMRVAGLAVSDNGRKIWVTRHDPGVGNGVVLQIHAFGTGDVTAALFQSAADAGQDGATAQGAHFFAHELTVDEALGPLFNARACASCHHAPTIGGMGITPTASCSASGAWRRRLPPRVWRARGAPALDRRTRRGVRPADRRVAGGERGLAAQLHDPTRHVAHRHHPQ